MLLFELTALVARMLRAPVEEIDPRLPFLEMGADSLALTEIVRVIQTTYGLKLSIRQFFEETTTIEALAARLDERLPQGTPRPPAADVRPIAEPPGVTQQTAVTPLPGVLTPLPGVTQQTGVAPPCEAAAVPLHEAARDPLQGVATIPSKQGRLPAAGEGAMALILGQQLQLVSQLIASQLALLGGRGLAGTQAAGALAPQLASSEQAQAASVRHLANGGGAPNGQTLSDASSATNGHGVSNGHGATNGHGVSNGHGISNGHEVVGHGATNGHAHGAVASPVVDRGATPGSEPPPASRVLQRAPSRRLDERQERHLAALVERYTLRTRRSKELAQRHRQQLADSRATVGFRFSTKEMLYPIVGQRSAGSRLWDVDGNEYVDVTMGFGVHLFGNRPPFLDEALREEIANGADLGPRSRLAGEVVELLCELTGHERAAFCNSGTEAVMTAIRLARARTGRSRIVVFAGSYHGHSDGTLAERNPAGGTLDSLPVAPGIPASVASDVLVLDYGSEESLAILRQHGGSIAAVLVEPVQSRRPSLQPVEFLRELRAITEHTGTALIFDEMITGFRVHPAGAQGLFGVQADLATYGKIVGGGMPIGVVAGRAAFLDGIDGGAWQYSDRSYPKEEMTFFGGTFCQHPLTMAAARAVLLRLRNEGPGLQRALSENTAAFAQAANQLLEARRAPVRLEHFGSLFRFGSSSNMDLLFYHLLERGVYIWEWRCCFLSTAHTPGDTSLVLKALESTLDELDASGFLDDPGQQPIDSPLSSKSSPGALRAPARAASSAERPPSDERARVPALSAARAVEPTRGVPGFVDRRRGVTAAVRADGAGADTASSTALQSAPSAAVVRAPLELSLSFFGKYEAEFRRDKYDLLFESTAWADTRGFRAVWLPERHFHAFGGLSPNPSVLAASLARHTKRLSLRAGSVVLPLHNPIRVAEEWAVVDNLSGGRVGVAFASGWHPDDFALAPENYGKHREVTFRDAEVVRRLWRGEPVSVRGGAGNAIDVRLHPLPMQPELPVWFTIVNNPETYVKAGELGVGVLTNLMGQTQADLRRNIALYRGALAQHGWPAEKGHVTALLHTFVGSSLDHARETARRPFGAYLESSIGLFRNLMKSEKLEVDFDDLTADDRQVLCDKAFERYLDSAILVGSPDSCEKVARDLHELGVDEIAAFVDFGVAGETVLSNLGHLGELREQCSRARGEERPTLSSGLGASPEVGNAPSTPRLERRALLPAQAQMWVLGQISPEAVTAYTDMVALELGGGLDLDALESALAQLVARHEALRSCFGEDGNDQVIVAEAALLLPVVDLAGDRSSEQPLREWIRTRTRVPLDLHAAPALEAHLLRCNAAQHVLVLRAHHAFVDGWSLGNLVKELGPLYAAARAGRIAELPAAPQFAEFASWQAQLLSSERAARAEAYWLAQLQGELPRAALPSDRPRPAQPTFAGARETVRLDERLVLALREVSRASGCTPFMTHLALYVHWLRQLCGQDELLVGVAIGNRPPELGDGLVGSMSQLLPLRFDARSDLTLGEWLRAVRGRVLEAFDHSEYSYARLIQRLGAGQDPTRAPLANVVFNYDTPLEAPSFGDLAVRALPREIGFARYDLYLNVATIGGQVELECDYDEELFDAATVRRYLAGYVQLVEQLASGGTEGLGRRLSAMGLVGAEDARRLVVDYNATARSPGLAFVSVQRQIESWARATPHAPAVVLDAALLDGVRTEGGSSVSQQLTFAQLDARVQALASALRQRALGSEARVAILAPRSPELLIGILGVLAAGLAFVPLEPAHPRERLSLLLADAGVQLALSTTRLAPLLADVRIADAALETLLLDAGLLDAAAPQTDAAREAAEQHPATSQAVAPEQLAYVMYTSGSTGRPKGVMISHQALADYVSWCREVYPLGEGEGVPLHGSIAFDATLTSIFAPLCSGRCVFVVPDELEIEGLVRALRTGRRYAFVKLTPSHLALLEKMGAGESLAASTGALILGGEALTGAVLEPWRARAPGLRIFNEYGPTEAVVGCALHEGWDALPLSGALSIGRPAADTQLYVLDRQLQLVPEGVIGELYIGGVCLARGYAGAPAHTAERFQPNPFAGLSPFAPPGSRLYRTGDRARHLADGSLELLGRNDDQVKIRGVRVELGEIASVLGQHPRVRQALALARDGVVVAYVSSDAARLPLEASALRAELHERAKSQLPAAVVPASFVILESLPLTTSGKIDSARLPSAAEGTLAAGEVALAPRSELESTVARVWCELLGLQGLGIHQNFFDLGGHSHLLVRAHQKLVQVLGRDIAVLELFRHPTVASLASFLSGAPAAAPAETSERSETRARARRSAFAGLRERAERGRA